MTNSSLEALFEPRWRFKTKIQIANFKYSWNTFLSKHDLSIAIIKIVHKTLFKIKNHGFCFPDHERIFLRFLDYFLHRYVKLFCQKIKSFFSFLYKYAKVSLVVLATTNLYPEGDFSEVFLTELIFTAIFMFYYNVWLHI